MLDTFVGNEAEERRLFQLYGQSLAQRAIEDRITSGICKIGQDDRVLVGELWCAVKIEITRPNDRQQYSSGGSNHLPRFWGSSGGAGLQSLKIRANLRSALIP